MVDYRSMIPGCPEGHGSHYCTFESRRWSCGVCGATFEPMPIEGVKEADKSVEQLIREAYQKAGELKK